MGLQKNMSTKLSIIYTVSVLFRNAQNVYSQYKYKLFIECVSPELLKLMHHVFKTNCIYIILLELNFIWTILFVHVPLVKINGFFFWRGEGWLQVFV